MELEENMDSLKVAFATNDGENFMSDHFGDADYYHIYEINAEGATLIKKIENTTEEEDDIHADPEKAKSISTLLQQEEVSVAVSKVFGPNIQRIKKKFQCILLKEKTLQEGVVKISENFPLIRAEWEKGEARDFLML